VTDGEQLPDPPRVEVRWQDRAECAGVSSWVFFPGENDHRLSPHDPAWLKARAFCSACRVRSNCLEFALLLDLKFGMFGGATPKERRAIARDRAA
jgi:WhiB family transcriptional regulator, redox-sensing transcriptional regulator